MVTRRAHGLLPYTTDKGIGGIQKRKAGEREHCAQARRCASESIVNGYSEVSGRSERHVHASSRRLWSADIEFVRALGANHSLACMRVNERYPCTPRKPRPHEAESCSRAADAAANSNIYPRAHVSCIRISVNSAHSFTVRSSVSDERPPRRNAWSVKRRPSGPAVSTRFTASYVAGRGPPSEKTLWRRSEACSTADRIPRASALCTPWRALLNTARGTQNENEAADEADGYRCNSTPRNGLWRDRRV